jgi:uncharacterized protein
VTVKYLLVLLVVVVGAWLLLRRRERPPPPIPRAPPKSAEAPKRPAQDMLACAHCGVHLPQPEAQFDAGGRPFCSEAHRLIGPRASG